MSNKDNFKDKIKNKNNATSEFFNQYEKPEELEKEDEENNVGKETEEPVERKDEYDLALKELLRKKEPEKVGRYVLFDKDIDRVLDKLNKSTNNKKRGRGGKRSEYINSILRIVFEKEGLL